MSAISYDFQEGQIVELFHGVPANAWDIYTAPDDVIRSALAWNDSNGDFDRLERVRLLEVFLSEFIVSKRNRLIMKNEMYGHEQFVCVWNVATDKFVTEIHGADFFSHDNGYSDDDIGYVTDLLIGESTDISGPTQAHYVLRVY